MTTVTTEHAGDLTVSQLAAEGGVSASAVRFYESNGLIPGRRTGGNQRRFDPHLGCWVKLIRVCQRVGLTVAEIRDLLALLPQDTEPTVKDWAMLNDRLEAELKVRMAELQELLDELSTDTKLCELPTVDDIEAAKPQA